MCVWASERVKRSEFGTWVLTFLREDVIFLNSAGFIRYRVHQLCTTRSSAANDSERLLQSCITCKIPATPAKIEPPVLCPYDKYMFDSGSVTPGVTRLESSSRNRSRRRCHREDSTHDSYQFKPFLGLNSLEISWNLSAEVLHVPTDAPTRRSSDSFQCVRPSAKWLTTRSFQTERCLYRRAAWRGVAVSHWAKNPSKELFEDRDQLVRS